MAGKYILVVEDEPDQMDTIVDMLVSKGFEAGMAYDGVEGKESVQARRPDLIILDVMMPRKDGWALCAELKDDERTADIPIIMLTAVGDELTKTKTSDRQPRYTRDQGMKTEADDYIPKPVDTRVLFEAVSRLL